MVELQKLLEIVIDKKASDLHITTGAAAQFRVDGKLVSFDSTILSATDTKRLCYSLLSDAQRHKFEEENELDFSFGIKGSSRVRGDARHFPLRPLVCRHYMLKRRCARKLGRVRRRLGLKR